MHVYTIHNFVRQTNLQTIVKMKDNSMTENIFVVKSSLIEYGGIDEMNFSQKLVCCGANGASVMQGHKHGHKVKRFCCTLHCWHSLHGPQNESSFLNGQ